MVPAHVSLGAHLRSYGDGCASTGTETTANAREPCFTSEEVSRTQDNISDHTCHAGNDGATLVPQRHSQDNLTSPKRSRMKHGSISTAVEQKLSRIIRRLANVIQEGEPQSSESTIWITDAHSSCG